MEDFYRVKQIAERFQVSDLTIRRYIKAGKLGASKIGKNLRISESDLERFLSKAKSSAKK